jgi:hypothetical protein
MTASLAFLSGAHLLWSAVGFGLVFGFLLHRGGVTDFNVIVNFFRLKDLTVLKVMLTAIVVGGSGVALLHGQDLAQFHIKPATMLAVGLGAALFGFGMVVYGYCPGTGLAAIAAGHIDALVGFLGMLVGGALYALSFDWVATNILPVGDLGKARLPTLTGTPEWPWYFGLTLLAFLVFRLVRKYEQAANS